MHSHIHWLQNYKGYCWLYNAPSSAACVWLHSHYHAHFLSKLQAILKKLFAASVSQQTSLDFSQFSLQPQIEERVVTWLFSVGFLNFINPRCLHTPNHLTFYSKSSFPWNPNTTRWATAETALAQSATEWNTAILVLSWCPGQVSFLKLFELWSTSTLFSTAMALKL
jgi:hypothetical protein